MAIEKRLAALERQPRFAHPGGWRGIRIFERNEGEHLAHETTGGIDGLPYGETELGAMQAEGYQVIIAIHPQEELWASKLG